MVGNLFTTAGRKRVVIFVAGHTHNSSKVHIISILIFFPLGAWWTAEELLAGRMWPAGCRLPTFAISDGWHLNALMLNKDVVAWFRRELQQ